MATAVGLHQELEYLAHYASCSQLPEEEADPESGPFFGKFSGGWCTTGDGTKIPVEIFSEYVPFLTTREKIPEELPGEYPFLLQYAGHHTSASLNREKKRQIPGPRRNRGPIWLK